MIAAIYARKSTEQSGIADEQKSVVRQVDHARAYATLKGWTVDEAFVFVDDGISGAEFANRPGFLRLMNALKPRPPFQVLVMSEESRLGREAIETAYALKQLVTAGVRVFFYLEGRERTLDNPTDKIMLSLTTFADELEREKARQRVTDAMLRKARSGHCCGGRVFGYDNVEIADTKGNRSHVERRVNETEAAIVRKIFERCASGTGYTRIAKQLNAEQAPAPRPKPGRVTGWAPSSVREILYRRLYLGEIIWNKTKKTDAWGQKNQTDRQEGDWIRITDPALRVVYDAQWQAVHGRLTVLHDQLRQASGGQHTHRRRDVDSRYLLSGFARCAVCGGGLGVMGGSHSSDRPHVYGCTVYHKRGTAVCGNGLKIPIDRVDDAVLKSLGGDVLRSQVAMAIVDGVLAEFQPRNLVRDLARYRDELQAMEREAERLTEAIAAGGHLAPLLEALKVRQARCTELAATIATLERIDVARFDRKLIEQRVRGHIDRWRNLLMSHVADGRQLLREVLVAPLRFTPEGRTYRFEGEAAIGQLIAGSIDLPTNVVAVRGIEPRFRG